MTEPSLAKSRSNARKKAMQALYQWSMSDNDLNDIEVQFHDEQDMSKVDQDYFHTLLHEIPAQVEALDGRSAIRNAEPNEGTRHDAWATGRRTGNEV